MERKKKKPGRKHRQREKYRGHNSITLQLNELFSPDNPDCFTDTEYSTRQFDDHVEAIAEYLKCAGKAKKLIRLQTGIWYCCMKEEDDDQTRTFCVMYHMAYGKAIPLVNLHLLVWDIFPESQYHIHRIKCDDPKGSPKILAALHLNIRKSMQERRKNTLMIPHVAMYTLTKKDTVQPGT